MAKAGGILTGPILTAAAALISLVTEVTAQAPARPTVLHESSLSPAPCRR